MPQPAIKVQGLSKEYIIGRQQKGQETFREMIAGAVAAPFQSLRKMRGDVAPEERFWALKDINFEVQPGEVVGVIGRNGAGKSTLLKILSRITDPTHGEVQIRGRVSSLLEVGTGFHPELTGRENIFLNGAILGMGRQEVRRKLDEIIDFAEIENFIDTPVKHFSSGMYVRLAFAVSAHLEPDILVVDEVLAVGDAEFQNKCLKRMRDVAEIGRTVIVVSHNLSTIQTLCRSGIYLHKGELRATGAVPSIISQYMEGIQAVTEETTRPLGADAVIQMLHVGDGKAHSMSPTGFEIQLAIRTKTTVFDLSVLIFSPLGQRIAIIDCRSAGLPVVIDTGEMLKISGDIASLNLVEGDYRLGLYLRTSETVNTFTDLASLTVLPVPQSSDSIQYPTEVRGFVQFDTCIHREA